MANSMQPMRMPQPVSKPAVSKPVTTPVKTAPSKTASPAPSKEEAVPVKKHSLWWLWLLIGLIVGVAGTTGYFMFLA